MTLNVAHIVRDLRDADPQALADVLSDCAAPHAADVVLYLADFQQVVLQAVPGRHEQRVLVEEAVSTSLAGRAFVTGSTVTAQREDGVRVWVPVFDQSTRIGVLAATVRPMDDAALTHCAHLATLAGLLVAAATPFTDLVHVRRRGRGMTLAASMQWDLLPPLTLRTERVVVTGALEPAYEVAGDAFDYAINDTRLDVAILDGMGHGVASSQLTGLAVGAYRHARRNGAGLGDIFASVDSAIGAQYDGDAFVTGVLARLDTATGRLSWCSAGHPPPLLLRNRRMVGPLRGEPLLPFGLANGPAQPRTVALEPGDSVLLYTDGVVEARTASGEEFGLERLADLLEREAAADTGPEETLRRLVGSILAHQAGLRDDATLLMVTWSEVDPPAAAAAVRVGGMGGEGEAESSVPAQDAGPGDAGRT